MTVFTGIVWASLCAAAGLAGAQSVTFKQSVKLVEVYATVLDHRGRPVENLTPGQFEVVDNGQPQPIGVFAANAEAVSCALLFDTTASMHDVLPEVVNAARDFIEALRPGDSASVYTFSEQLTEIQANTTDKAAISRALVRLRAAGRTALFDSLSELARELEKRPGKKAIVLLTDGGDNSSVLNRESAARRARATGIPVYAVAEGDALHDEASERLLHKLSESTGGRSYRAKNSKVMRAVFADITASLRGSYLLAFQPREDPNPGAWHELRVNVKGSAEALQIRSRAGYAAE